MNDAYQSVLAFHKAFGVPYIEGSPRMLSADRTWRRVAWMREEIGEFEESRTLEDQADAMIDLIYFALGTLVEMGVPPKELFDIVHEANMTKLFPDGKPHYNADNKVIKPDGWRDPQPRMKAWLENLADASADPGTH